MHDINAPSSVWNSWQRQKGRPGRPLLYSNHNLNHTQRHFYATTHVYCKSSGLRHRKCKMMIREGKTSTDRFIWLSTTTVKNVIRTCSYLHFYWKTLWGFLCWKLRFLAGVLRWRFRRRITAKKHQHRLNIRISRYMFIAAQCLYNLVIVLPIILCYCFSYAFLNYL